MQVRGSQPHLPGLPILYFSYKPLKNLGAQWNTAYVAKKHRIESHKTWMGNLDSLLTSYTILDGLLYLLEFVSWPVKWDSSLCLIRLFKNGMRL